MDKEVMIEKKELVIEDLKSLKKPHPTKAVFRKFKVPIDIVALNLGLSYPYVSLVLSGSCIPSSTVDRKLWKLADHIRVQGRKRKYETDSR